MIGLEFSNLMEKSLSHRVRSKSLALVTRHLLRTVFLDVVRNIGLGELRSILTMAVFVERGSSTKDKELGRLGKTLEAFYQLQAGEPYFVSTALRPALFILTKNSGFHLYARTAFSDLEKN